MSHIAGSFDWGSETERSNGNTFDWSNEEGVSLSVVTTVAEVMDVEPTELQPLSASIDTDALNTLFRPSRHNPRERGQVKFEYEGCLVRIDADGEVVATPIES
jgi:hypothetical protein